MTDEFEHHEKIRERINDLITTSILDTGITVDPIIKHLLVNICKSMYDKGVQDGHRICQKVISVSMDVYKE